MEHNSSRRSPENLFAPVGNGKKLTTSSKLPPALYKWVLPGKLSLHNMVKTVLSCIMVHNHWLYVDYISLRVYIGSFAVFRKFENFEIDIALAEYCSQQIQVLHQLSVCLIRAQICCTLHCCEARKNM